MPLLIDGDLRSGRTPQLFLASVAKSQFNMTSFMGVGKLTSEHLSDSEYDAAIFFVRGIWKLCRVEQ